MKNLQIASRLINSRINEIIEHWGKNEMGKNYLIRHCESSNDRIEIQPTYSSTFYGIEQFIHIAEACGCGFYIDIEENQSGILAPTLNIY